MTDMDEGRVRDLLRTVGLPGVAQDIVGDGLIGEITSAWPRVAVTLHVGGQDAQAVDDLERRVRTALREAHFVDIHFGRTDERAAVDHGHDHGHAGCGCDGGESKLMTPLQAEFLEDGELPEDDLLAVVLGRPDVAGDAGYRPGGPDPLAGPREPLTYECDLKVLQWDINPHDASQVTRQHEIKVDEWDYRVWWQVHPRADLLYVSMQAMREDWVVHQEASPHPVGRSEAVNLVFDQTRDAVVAIYGTVRDFRPFVKAFSLAYAIDGGGANPTEENKP